MRTGRAQPYQMRGSGDFIWGGGAANAPPPLEALLVLVKMVPNQDYVSTEK